MLELQQSQDDHGTWVSVARVTPAGSVVWRIGPPDFVPDDVWTGVRIDEHVLALNSWSTYLVTLDIRTGERLRATFTK